MVAIRDAAPADAQGLAVLAERCFRDTFEAANTPADMAAHCAASFGPARQQAEITDPDWCTLLAWAQDALAGFGQLRRSAAPGCVTAGMPMEIYRLYVDRPWHGRGVAGPLMDAMLARAGLEGADAVWLGVWEHNPRAIAFYRKAGFETVGSHRFLLGADLQTDLVMCRALAG